MHIIFWILIALLLWVGGYRSIHTTKQNFLFPFIGSFVRPPKWLFYLCGNPKSPLLPYGVMSGKALALQILGILFAGYGIAIDKHWPIQDPNLSAYVGVSICFLLSCIITYVIYKVYPYIDK